jgi:cysteine desulfurase
MNEPIYLDHNATTPCDPRVVEKMLPYFCQVYGNPSNSLHRQGRMAAKAVDMARQQVADLIEAQPGEIYFTSGATESSNLAIFGVAKLTTKSERRGIVTCQIEHKAVLLPCKKLELSGFEVTILPVDTEGRVRMEDVAAAIDDKTLLVTIQAANNEIGTLQPIAEIAAIAHQHGALMHTDAAQLVGKLPVSVDILNIDLLSMSAHKLYGPKGVGALYIRGGTRHIPIEPLIIGGGQEGGLRSGTTNVPAIVGFGEACRIAKELISKELISDAARIGGLHDQLEQTLIKKIPPLRINGKNAPRLPNTSSLTFPGVDADALLLNLPEVMMGTGSACTSGAIEPSHVLQAIGLSRADASSTVRASLGRFTNESDIQKACILISEVANRLQSQA